MNTLTSPSNDSTQNLATLTPAQLLARLVHEEDRAPLELIDACVARGEAMVEALRDAIDDENMWNDDTPGAWWLPLHAAFILGRMPTESAGLLLVRLMRRMDEYEDDDLQDWLAGDWPFLFVNKPPAAIDAARELTEDASRDWYIRCQALDVVLDAGMREGDAALERAIDWVAALASNESDEWMFRAMAACALLDFPRTRHRALLETIAKDEALRMNEQDWSMSGIFTNGDVDSAFNKGKDEPGWHRRSDPWKFYDPDLIAARQRRWQEEDARAEARAYQYSPTTYVRPTPKIGRNDPCPCGSGKKYKRCCLANDEGSARAIA
jgi:hypothetical protein